MKTPCPYFRGNTSKIVCLIEKTPSLVAKHCRDKTNPCVWLKIHGLKPSTEKLVDSS